MNKQTHRTCVRMSAKEYSRLMERSRAAGLSANAWLMEQLAGNRPIISRNGVMSDFLCLLNQKGREINTVARGARKTPANRRMKFPDSFPLYFLKQLE